MNYIIIGSSQGIGFEIAKFLKTKNNLILCSRKKTIFQKKLFEDHEFIKVDATNIKDIKKLGFKLKAKKIKLDGAIFCQGLLGSPIDIFDIKEKNKWQKIFETNFNSNLNLIRYLLPFIKKKSFSKIIFFSGGGAFNTWPKFSAYSISKTALVRYSENLAEELKNQKIIVTCLAPGFINTKIHQENFLKLNKLNKKYRDELKKNKNTEPNFKNIVELTNYVLKTKNMLISGKTISANYDPWRSKNFLNLLKKNKQFLTLSRININY